MCRYISDNQVIHEIQQFSGIDFILLSAPFILQSPCELPAGKTERISVYTGLNGLHDVYK